MAPRGGADLTDVLLPACLDRNEYVRLLPATGFSFELFWLAFFEEDGASDA